MRSDENVRLSSLREYLFQVSSCKNRQELMHTACVEMQRLIPFDQTTGVFDMSDCRSLEGTGKSDPVTAAYNNYYRKIKPPYLPSIVDWRRYDALEYAVDFMFANRMFKGLRHVVPGHRLYICVYRSRRCPDFLESDLDMLGIVDEYLNNLYSSLDAEGDVPDPGMAVEAIRDRFTPLSRREAEVCALVARRLNTAEIAASLFISGRTVEKHIQSIFDKLDVRTREQLRWRLGVALPARGAQPSSASL